VAVTRPTNFAVGAADGIVMEPQAVNVNDIAAMSAGTTVQDRSREGAIAGRDRSV
jgi:hypothetical protein